MRQTSFTIDIIPRTRDDGYADVTVKTIDWDGENWLEVKRVLEKKIVFEANDVADQDILLLAANVASRISRILAHAAVEVADAEHK